MIHITQIKEFSHLSGEPKERAEESVKVWEVRYGAGNDAANHTVLFTFGLIALNAAYCTGMLWAEATQEARLASFSARREALRAWRSFAEDNGWTLFAYCKIDNKTQQNFLRWLGFIRHAEQADAVFYKGVF